MSKAEDEGFLFRQLIFKRDEHVYQKEERNFQITTKSSGNNKIQKHKNTWPTATENGFADVTSLIDFKAIHLVSIFGLKLR